MGGTGMMRAFALCLAMLGLGAPQMAAAWGFYAHTVTADVAEANIAPATQRGIARLLARSELMATPDCDLDTLQDASVWPDCVRRDSSRWGYTAAWHYRTAPVCEAFNPRANCSGGACVTGQIERSHRLLADESLPAHIRLEALAFLVHFVGDVHMPLHSGDREDRGGNDREADYGIVPDLNLHWIWDGPLAERAITGEPPVARRYSPAERAELAGGDADDWGRESWQTARDIVYPNAFDRTPCEGELPDATALTQEDIVAAVPVARQRVVQAGLRIARLLDEAFAPGPLPPAER
jgi:hypothetical protein